MKKIFVAGHRGMVGSAICRQLQEQADVEIITRTRDELDLCDQSAVHAFMQSEKPDEVILAAAKVGGIHANNTYPAEFIYQNLQIQNNVIHASHVNDVQKLLFLGSSCIYPRAVQQPMREDALLTGVLEPTNEPYAIAKIAGLDHLQYFYSLITIVTFGFFLLNYPFGKLFLGDGGAYMLGFCLVWGGITLANQVAGLSAFAVLLIFFWPIADTMLAIWRRIKLSSPTSRPDRLHFHQLVMRFLEIRVLGRRRRQLSNPLATLIIAPLIVAPQIYGLIFAFEHYAAVVSSILFSISMT